MAYEPHVTPCVLLLLIAHLFFTPTCAAARTCDYRVVEEATYSAFNLTALGLNGSTSIAMNGDFSGAHGRAQSIESSSHRAKRTCAILPSQGSCQKCTTAFTRPA